MARGEFANRTDAVRTAPLRLEKDIRDREIADEYHRAYRGVPQEDWVGEFGLGLFAAVDDPGAPPETRKARGR